MSLFFCALGLALILEGIPYFTFPDKMKELLSKLPLMPATSLRLFGLTAIVIGLVIISIAKMYF